MRTRRSITSSICICRRLFNPKSRVAAPRPECRRPEIFYYRYPSLRGALWTLTRLPIHLENTKFPTVASETLNLSTRGLVSGGDNVLIGGFIITGTDPKTWCFARWVHRSAALGFPMCSGTRFSACIIFPQSHRNQRQLAVRCKPLCSRGQRTHAGQSIGISHCTDFGAGCLHCDSYGKGRRRRGLPWLRLTISRRYPTLTWTT